MFASSSNSDGLDVNDMIKFNKDMYNVSKASRQNSNLVSQNMQSLKSPPIKQEQSDPQNIQDSTFTINQMLGDNRAFYTTKIKNQNNQDKNQSQVINEKDQAQINKKLLKKTELPFIDKLPLIYNYQNIVLKSSIGLQETKELDDVREKRREMLQSKRQKQESQSEIKKFPKQKRRKLFKDHLCQLVCKENNVYKLVSHNLNTWDAQEVNMNPAEFNYKRPSQSVVQEKTTGRFYIYDNSCGKVHIFSNDVLIDPAKDKPLVSLLLNEDPPRQDPLLFLVECEDEFEWKNILFVIGGYQSFKGLKCRPFRSIKVFVIKKREATLSPAITITMQYPRMHPVVVLLNKSKGLHWQDENMHRSIASKKYLQIDQPQHDKHLFIIGGNQLTDFENEENQELVEMVRNANKTCEHIEFKKILDHINRAQQIQQDEDMNMNSGLNLAKVMLNNLLNIKYQNDLNIEKIINSFHHATIANIQDEVFHSDQQILICGSGNFETLQLKAISFKQFEINFVPGKLYLQKPTLFFSKCMMKYQFFPYNLLIRYMKPQVRYISEYKDLSQVFVLVDVDTGPRGNSKSKCGCQIF